MYVKIFADILQSSLWEHDAETCKVWITMLVLANRDGFVRATLPGIAHEARVDREKTAEVINLLESQDTHSRTTEHDGRRIERVDGGYMILNYCKYRALRDEDTRREQTKERVRKHRQCNACVTSVTPRNTIADTEADTDTEAGTKKPPNPLVESPTESAPTAAPAEPDGSGLRHDEQDIVATAGKQNGRAETAALLEAVKASWNCMAAEHGFSAFRDWGSGGRRDAIRARLKDRWWRENWQAALMCIPQSDFCLGKRPPRKPGGKRFIANIDWFVASDSVLKILEGKYANETAPDESGQNLRPEDREVPF